MAERRALLLAAALVMALAASGCMRPTGDFGRAQPGVLHDEIMPTAGRERAILAGEPVSRFNLTDEEREMHDRIWRFLVAPHAQDWFFDTVAEFRRTRLAGPRGHKFRPDRYYHWLKSADYRSSRTRYATIADHVGADIATMARTFRAICAVLEIDRRRETASASYGGLEAREVATRSLENRATIAWFVSAAGWRQRAYSHALDRLIVETPHEQAIGVDATLGDLVLWVGRAERGEFCDTRPVLSWGGGEEGDIPSRMHMGSGSLTRK